ncbi:MAG: putative transcriptional regulator [Conexibacter sp.]|nr:putative transcriptional regulator [Conexibacter sp.]
MSSLSTIKKIGPVLDLFTAEKAQWRMTDIARALDMPKSSAHTLVTTLAEVGLLSVGPDGQYRLGWNLLSLSERMRAGVEFRQHALPHMQHLSRELNETVLLAVLDRSDVVYIERVEGTHPMVRLAGVRVGARLRAHVTGVGKVLLANRAPAEVRALLETSGMKPMTKRSITSISEFEKSLVTVRAQGVAFDLCEVVPDVACIAAPITDRYGTVIAGVSVSIPAYRFPKERGPLIHQLKFTASRISDAIATAAEHEPKRARPFITVTTPAPAVQPTTASHGAAN